jgi:hypothetical protein
MFNTGACPSSTAVLTIGKFWRCFWQQLDRLRLTTIYRDRTRPNETFIYTIPKKQGGNPVKDILKSPNQNSGDLHYFNLD